mgnify:FL=1|jgi:hypothetical protein
MKVVIGPYTTWIGPYQIAEKLCFWAKPERDEIGMKSKPDWVHEFGRWLSENKDGSDSTLTKVCQWVESKRHRQIYVRIDKYDTWGMDHTLAQIILPMLKQLKASKHGAPNTDDVDVPKELWSTNAEPKENEHDTDSNHFKRWDWILDEMIFAFESKRDGTWQDKYSSGVMDWTSEPCEWDENGKAKMFTMGHGPKHTYKCDYEGMAVEQKRISKGFKLFGKYYENLWD